MTLKNAYVFVLITLFLIICNCNKIDNDEVNTSTQNSEKLEVADSIHTSQNSLDWAGLYQGETPCADCEGIFTTLFIQQTTNAQLNADVTYIYLLRQQYSSKSDVYFYEQGSFIWQENGSVIKLLPNTDGLNEGNSNSPRFYKVVENALVMLNLEGKPIEGSSFSEKYRLEKSVDLKDFPSFVPINLIDDYSSSYKINPFKWVQDEKNVLHIVEWNIEEGYLIAQNDAANKYAPAKWSRIDWVDLEKNQLPYRWAFCMISYKEESKLDAVKNNNVDKKSLLNGCNGFPFTRLKIKE